MVTKNEVMTILEVAMFWHSKKRSRDLRKWIRLKRGTGGNEMSYKTEDVKWFYYSHTRGLGD